MQFRNAVPRRPRSVATALLSLVLMLGWWQAAGASRIKDIASLEGSDKQPLLGYGLVVGLNGTGDGQSAAYTVQSLTAMLERLDVTVDPALIKLKNVAAVLLTAQVDPGTVNGSRVDVTVSSLGDAKSLEGGVLIMSTLKGTDGQVYAVAQGPVSIGGFNVSGGANNSIRKNHSTVGRIPNGGKIVRDVPGALVRAGRLGWLLHNPDFTTAQRVADAINRVYGGATARAVSAQRVEVNLPEKYVADPVAFVAAMGQLEAEGDQAARVVINERTGTIIVGKGVQLREAAVAQGNLKVVIRTRYDVSQPNSFNESGRTVVTPAVNADVQEKQASVIHVPASSTVADVVNLLNDVGATPRDIIAILQALKQAGSLQAELVIM